MLPHPYPADPSLSASECCWITRVINGHIPKAHASGLYEDEMELLFLLIGKKPKKQKTEVAGRESPEVNYSQTLNSDGCRFSGSCGQGAVICLMNLTAAEVVAW